MSFRFVTLQQHRFDVVKKFTSLEGHNQYEKSTSVEYGKRKRKVNEDKEETLKGGKERRTQAGIVEEEEEEVEKAEEEEQVCQSCLLIGWRCTENKRQTQPAVTFQITLPHTNTHLPTRTHTRKVCSLLCTPFKEMSP